jgi:hypothetical protein
MPVFDRRTRQQKEQSSELAGFQAAFSRETTDA